MGYSVIFLSLFKFDFSFFVQFCRVSPFTCSCYSLLKDFRKTLSRFLEPILFHPLSSKFQLSWYPEHQSMISHLSEATTPSVFSPWAAVRNCGQKLVQLQDSFWFSAWSLLSEELYHIFSSFLFVFLSYSFLG